MQVLTLRSTFWSPIVAQEIESEAVGRWIQAIPGIKIRWKSNKQRRDGIISVASPLVDPTLFTIKGGNTKYSMAVNVMLFADFYFFAL